MRITRLRWTLVGAVAGFVVSLLGMYIGLTYGFEWVQTILAPGIWVAGLTSSVAAGFLTMVLIGAVIGTLFGLLTGSSDAK